jgi:hypothetical protein
MSGICKTEAFVNGISSALSESFSLCDITPVACIAASRFTTLCNLRLMTEQMSKQCKRKEQM